MELERGQVFNSSGKVLSSIIRFWKAFHSSSLGTEDNIEPSTMECDTKDFINGLSEEKFVTSNPALVLDGSCATLARYHIQNEGTESLHH